MVRRNYLQSEKYFVKSIYSRFHFHFNSIPFHDIFANNGQKLLYTVSRVQVNSIFNLVKKGTFTRFIFLKKWFRNNSMQNSKFTPRWKNFSSNHFFSDFFSKNVTFTKFLPKEVRVNFRNFHSVYCGITFF